jgi:hypothetical protein
MLDPFFYLEWLAEKDCENTFPDLKLVKENKEFTKILVIPFYPIFYQSFLNTKIIAEKTFKIPEEYFEKNIYHLVVKHQFTISDFSQMYSTLASSKTSFFTEDDFLLMRNLLIKNCKNQEYDQVVTISNKDINFEHLNFLKYKELKKEKIYGR